MTWSSCSCAHDNHNHAHHHYNTFIFWWGIVLQIILLMIIYRIMIKLITTVAMHTMMTLVIFHRYFPVLELMRNILFVFFHSMKGVIETKTIMIVISTYSLFIQWLMQVFHAHWVLLHHHCEKQYHKSLREILNEALA